MTGTLRIGTSGYHFVDWVGTVYPPGTSSRDFLSHYARLFDVVEINATYYRIPPAATFRAMRRKVPPDFAFVVKLPKAMTHEREGFHAAVDPFFTAIEPLREGHQLGGLLAQFPYSFKPGKEAEDHLRRVAAEVAAWGVPVSVEVRHASWYREETYALLRGLGLGFVNVDLPPLPNLPKATAIATTDVGYVRLHGRNARAWWGEDEKARYDYLYSERELEEWAPRIEQAASQSRVCYLFANNCHLGQSVVNALQLRRRFGLPQPAGRRVPMEGMFALQDDDPVQAIQARIEASRRKERP